MSRITTFTNDGLEFTVRDTGPLDGTPVVLLHGFPQRGGSWDQVAVPLHEAGYRTLAPDQRGYSAGARPRSVLAYRTPELVGDLAALVDAIGTPVHLVGHDWGAVVAWSAAARHPELVRTLTSVSVPHPRAFLASMVRSRQLLASWYMGLFNLPGVVETAARRRPEWVSRGLRSAGMTPEMVELFHREIVADGALPGALRWYRALPLTDPRTTGGAVRVPTTHVWSDRDTALTRTGAELAEEYVDAPYRLEILEGVSHWIPDHAPDELARIIRTRAESA